MRRYDRAMESTARWLAALAEFAPSFIESHAVLKTCAETSAAVLHGSICYGIDDELADLDVWLIMPETDLACLDQASPTRFFEFSLEGKPGHFTAVSADSFMERMRHCDLPLIAEMRAALPIREYHRTGAQLIEAARQPMPADVRRAFFQYHYVEHRSDDRAADHPLERGDPVAALAAQTLALTHALRAVMVLHGQPYPYSKWLYRFARQTPTGQALFDRVEQWIDLLGRGGLREPAGAQGHILAQKMKEIRVALIDAAKAAGIDEPWLREWWLHIDSSRAQILKVRWPC
jgi:hypothetical protein